MSNQKNQPILTLSVAASLINLHPRTLMLYEKEGLIHPHRTSTNRRLFSRTDLAHIQFVQYLIEKKRTNLKSNRLILEILEKDSEKYPEIKKELFPDYAARELI